MDSFQADSFTPDSTASTSGFDWTTLLPTATSIAGGIGGSFIAPGLGTVGGYVGGGAAGEALRQKIKGEQFNPGQVLFQGGLGLIPFGLGKLGKIAGPIGKAIISSGFTKAGVGKNIEALAERGGPVTEELITKYLGTGREPNVGILKNVGTSEDATNFLNKLRHEVTVLGGDIKAPDFSKILSNRIGAGIQGYASRQPGGFLNMQRVTTPTSQYYRNLQGAYSNILHEGLPHIQPYDAAYSLLSKLQKYVPIVGGGAATIYGGGQLLKALVDRVTQEYQ